MVDHNQIEEATESNKNQLLLKNSEILSQSILFMMAGSETTSTVLSYITYNLVLNSDCQDKLINEIDYILDKHVIKMFDINIYELNS